MFHFIYDAVDKVILEKPYSINGKLLDVKKAILKEKMQAIATSTQGQNEISLKKNNFNGNNRDYNPPMPSIMDSFSLPYNSMEQNQPLPQPLMNFNPNMSFYNYANQIANLNSVSSMQQTNDVWNSNVYDNHSDEISSQNYGDTELHYDNRS